MELTKEQIDRLNQQQHSGKVHPYTCDRSGKCCETKLSPRDYSKDGILIATNEGWVCPCGHYHQSLSPSAWV